MERLTADEFIDKANIIHNRGYVYDKVNYINSKTKVYIICPTHGGFYQTPNAHLNGQGCPKCRNINNGLKKRLGVKSFIERSNSIHLNKYDYSKVEYVNSKTKVCINCISHGEFWQTPSNHLSGNGCPKCRRSYLEVEISKLLTSNKIKFIEQASKKDLQWLGLQRLDFYLPDYNIAIECQGKQHFVDGCTFGGNETLKIIKHRDKLKLDKCNENCIKLLYYSKLNRKYPYKVFEDKYKLLKEITGNGK